MSKREPVPFRLDSGALGADYVQVADQVTTRLGLENDDD